MAATNVNTNTAASGATNIPVATETIAAETFQRVKVALGASGVDDGDLQSKALDAGLAASDKGVIVQSVIHGKSSAGGGTYVDVKVTPSGAIVSDTSGSSVTLKDGGGNTIGSLTSGTGAFGLLHAAGATEFFFSTANTTTAQLASGATFTGTIESILNAQAFSIILTSDQNGTLTVTEFIDAAGLRPLPSKVFSITAGSGFSRCFTANGNYFRLTFQNTGGATTTTLNINTAFGTLPAVTTLGNAPVSLQEISGTALTLGQKTSAASIPVVLPSDGTFPLPTGAATQTTLAALYAALGGVPLPTGADFPITPSVPAVLSYPSSQNFTATGTSQFTIEPGATYVISLTQAPGATTGYVATIGWQWSTDGAAWNSGTAIPLSSLPGAGKVNASSSTSPGLWMWEAPTTAQFFRFNCTAYTSGNAWCYIEPFLPGVTVPMPWTPTVTSGQTVMPFVDTNLFAEFSAQISAVTTTVCTAQGTNDPTGATVASLGFKDGTANTTSGGTTISAATPAAVFSPTGFKWVRLQVTTTGTVFTIQGITGVLGAQANVLSGFTANTFTSTNNASVNVGQLGGATVLSLTPNGSTNRAGTSVVAGAISSTDYSAQAWAAASGSGATIADANGGGASAAFDVNLTAWTAGSSTGLVVYLQESPDNGTTWYDIWQCETLTAVSRARIPVLPIGGRRRMRWVNLTGAATTATVTVTAMDCSGWAIKQVQWFDRTSGVGSGTAVLNTNSASYDIAGCKAITVVMAAGTATAVGSFQAQMSMDGTNWYSASAATAISATTANMTTIPLTSGVFGRFIRVTCTAAGTTQVINAIHIYGTN